MSSFDPLMYPLRKEALLSDSGRAALGLLLLYYPLYTKWNGDIVSNMDGAESDVNGGVKIITREKIITRIILPSY